MPLSAFFDQSHQPTDSDVRTALGTAHAAWSRLVKLVSERTPAITPVWNFAGKSYGWSLRLRHKERNILYMTPRDGEFLASCALGERAVKAAESAKLPQWLLAIIASAPRYAEGRGVRVTVRRLAQVAAVARLAEIKDRH